MLKHHNFTKAKKMSKHHNFTIVEVDECDLTMCQEEDDGKGDGKCTHCGTSYRKIFRVSDDVQICGGGICGGIAMCNQCWSSRIGDNVCAKDGCERRVLNGVTICTKCGPT